MLKQEYEKDPLEVAALAKEKGLYVFNSLHMAQRDHVCAMQDDPQPIDFIDIYESEYFFP